MPEEQQGIHVTLKPEDIQRQIVDAVASSVLGETIQKQIAKLREDLKLDHSWNNAIKTAIEDRVKEVIRDLIYAPEIRGVIEAKVKELATVEAITKTTEAVWNRLVRGY